MINDISKGSKVNAKCEMLGLAPTMAFAAEMGRLQFGWREV